MQTIKKLFSIASLLLFFFLFSKQIKKSSTSTVMDSSTMTSSHPDKTIILWDLHGVVFRQKPGTLIRTLWQYNHKLDALKHLDGPLLKLMGNFLLQKFHFTTQEVTSEELIIAAQKANNNALIELAIETSLAYYPIKDTVKIIKKLHKLGYQQDIGSNIGAIVYEIFKDDYPAIFKYFNHVHIVRYYPGKAIIKKPNEEYFTTYLNQYNIKPEQVIFIDDKLPNVQAAQAVGMRAIHFKSPQQLRIALHNFGVPLNMSGIEKVGCTSHLCFP